MLLELLIGGFDVLLACTVNRNAWFLGIITFFWNDCMALCKVKCKWMRCMRKESKLEAQIVSLASCVCLTILNFSCYNSLFKVTPGAKPEGIKEFLPSTKNIYVFPCISSLSRPFFPKANIIYHAKALPSMQISTFTESYPVPRNTPHSIPCPVKRINP